MPNYTFGGLGQLCTLSKYYAVLCNSHLCRDIQQYSKATHKYVCPGQFYHTWGVTLYRAFPSCSATVIPPKVQGVTAFAG